MAELNALLTGGLFLSAMISGIVLVAGLCSSGLIAGWLHLTPNIDSALVERAYVLGVFASASMILYYGFSAFCLGLQSSVGVGVLFLMMTLMGMIVTVVLLYRGLGVLALPIGSLARGLGLIVSFGVYLAWRYKHESLRYRFTLRGVSTLAKLSSYNFLGQSSRTIAGNLDAFVVSRFLGAEMTPVYVLTRRAPEVCRMFVERPSLAFMPAISHLVGSGDVVKVKKVLLRLVRMTWWLLGLVCVGFIMLNDSFVKLWVGSQMFAGRGVNSILCIYFLMSSITMVVSNLSFSLGNIRGNSVAALTQSCLTVPLIVAGAMYGGLMGVAGASLVSVLAVGWYYPVAFARFLRVEKAEIIGCMREILAVALAAGVVFAGFARFSPGGWVAFVISVTGISVVYASILFMASGEFRSEVIAFISRTLRVKTVVTERKGGAGDA